MPFAQVEQAAVNLISHVGKAGVDVIVLELADGLYQRETAQLLSSQRFTSKIDGMIFAAGDAMGGEGGVEWLRRRKLPVLGVSGLLAHSPLAIREAAEVTDLPVFDMATLSEPQAAVSMVKPYLQDIRSGQAN